MEDRQDFRERGRVVSGVCGKIDVNKTYIKGVFTEFFTLAPLKWSALARTKKE